MNLKYISKKSFTKEKKKKMDIVTKFQVSIFKNDEVRGGGGRKFPPHEISWLRDNVE
jgi:hypothetical protein